ncbi:MAG TPA: OmpA family protein [Burkholderiales bacterium]|nr:OmpA family protein [Burkholderiales bacterium]
MKRKQFKLGIPALLVASAFAAGCATHTPQLASVQAAHEAYNAAAADPRVRTHADVELGRARASLAIAEEELRDSGDSAATNHLAYLARQRAILATEVAAQREADERIRMAGLERDRSLLQARTAEADRANQQAQIATMQADSARRQAISAQTDAEIQRQRAAQLEADLIAMQAVKSERGLILTLQDDVLFDTGSAALKSGAMRTIDRLAELLRNNPERRVQIEGFTDSQGSDSYNLDLSERRAASVRTALLARGVPMDRVSIQPYGEAFPIASNDTPSGRQLNRRVEIVFSDPQGVVVGRTGMSGSMGSQPQSIIIVPAR